MVDRRWAMTKGGAVLHELVHGRLDLLLGAGVHGGGGLVQDEHGLVGDHGPGDGELLLLPLGEAHLVVEDSVVPLGQGADEVVQAHSLAGFLHGLVTDPGGAVDQVFPDGALEEPGVLEDHAEEAVHRLGG